MSDQFDSLFARLRGQSPPAPFASAVAVRRRGRQRAQRQAVSAGVAVLAVTGLGAGGVVTLTGQPDPTEPPPAASPTGASPTSPVPTSPVTPARTEIPAEWLLTAGDLGPGDWVSGFEPEWAAGDPPWFWGGLCPDFQATSLADRIDLATEGWTDGPWAGETDGPPPNWVLQVVELFRPDTGAAEENLQDVQAVVDQCAAQVRLTPGVQAPEYEVVDSGFAGDESLLVLERAPGDASAYTAVVRVGNAVTSLRSYDVELARADAAYHRSLAERAAERLR